MTTQQYLLMRRMAIHHNRQIHRLSTPEENERIMPNAFRAMIYTATLNSFLYDLTDQLLQDNPNPRKEKRILQRIQKNASAAHEAIYKAFEQAYKGFGQYYNSEYDRAVEAINNHVTITNEGSRLYSIVLALCRLSEEMNDKCGRWHCPAIETLKPSERWLQDLRLPYEDKSDIVKTIIEMSYKIKLPRDYESDRAI